MENKVGYAYISLEEYTRLIRNEKIIEQYYLLEDKVLNAIYKKSDYYLKNMELNIDGSINFNEYHSQEIVKKFIDWGFKDMNYIYRKVIEMKEKKDKEQGD